MFHTYQHILLAIVLLAVGCHVSSAYTSMQTLEEFQQNPNVRCPGKNEDVNKGLKCEHGGYIVNPDPRICGDRYVCYVGLNEYCDPGDKCADNAICTMCGVCQKCESPEKCSDFKLCSHIRGFNLFKRMMQKRLFEYGIE